MTVFMKCQIRRPHSLIPLFGKNVHAVDHFCPRPWGLEAVRLAFRVAIQLHRLGRHFRCRPQVLAQNATVAILDSHAQVKRACRTAAPVGVRPKQSFGGGIGPSPSGASCCPLRCGGQAKYWVNSDLFWTRNVGVIVGMGMSGPPRRGADPGGRAAVRLDCSGG